MADSIAKNTAWLAGGEVIGRLFRIALIFFAARGLGAAEWGVSSYALSLAVLFTIATDVGLGAIVTRQIVSDRENRANYLSAFLFLKLALLIAGTSVIIFIVPGVGSVPLMGSLPITLALLVFFDSVRMIATVVNRARETMRLEATTNAITQGTILCGGLIMLSVMPSAEGLNIAYTAGSGIGTLVGLWTIRDHLPGIFTSFKAPMAKAIMKDALPVAAMGLMGAAMLNTDIIMLGWMRSPEEIGYYSAAQKIVFTLYVIPTLAAAAVFPALTRFANDKAKFKALAESAIRNMLAIGLPIALGGIVTARGVIALFYGAEYLPAIPPFIILLLTVPLIFATGIVNSALIAQNRQKAFFLYSLMGFALNIAFNWILIPRMGITGAALATLITSAASVVYIWIVARRVSDIGIPEGMGTIYGMTTGMAVLVWALGAAGVPVWAVVPAGIAAYALGLKAVNDPAFATFKR